MKLEKNKNEKRFETGDADLCTTAVSGPSTVDWTPADYKSGAVPNTPEAATPDPRIASLF